MTKFQDLNAEQQEGIRQFLLIAVERKVREEIDYTNQCFRLLILGNGAGIALLATFMGAIVAKGNPINELVSPLWKFLLGASFGALIYAPLMLVASQATVHSANQLVDFIQNKIELEDVQGWGLTKIGRFLVFGFIVVSLSMFVWGVVQCIRILSAH